MEAAVDLMLFNIALVSLYVFIPLTYLGLQFIQAPYGKLYRPGWGPSLNPALAWFLMESPTLFVTITVFPLGANRSHPTALFLIAFYFFHYFHRTLLYPLYLRKAAPASSSPFPLSIALLAFIFNVLNAYIQSRWISEYADLRGVARSQLLLGSVVFVAGFALNVWSDRVLLGLKRQGKGYRVPSGGMFQLVCCPNYLGEMLEWMGWAIMTWSWAGLAFFLYTSANLVPRARSNRRWYLHKFPEEFPTSRKAIIPFLY